MKRKEHRTVRMIAEAGFMARIMPVAWMASALLLLPLVSPCQSLSALASLDTTSALLGDQLHLRISVEKPSDASVSLPDLSGLAGTMNRDIEVISASAVDSTRLRNGTTRLEQEWLLAAFDTGIFEIPSLAVAFTMGDINDTLLTSPVFFEIRSMPLDSTIRDIKANLRAPVALTEVLPFAAGALLLAAVIYYALRYFRNKYRGLPEASAEGDLEPPEVTALHELQRLRDEEPWKQKSIKPYYIRLTEILRIYIERKYKVMALERTSAEILTELGGTPCSPGDREKLGRILELADFVKFAKLVPGEEESRRQLDMAEDFVRSTSAEPVPAMAVANEE